MTGPCSGSIVGSFKPGLSSVQFVGPGAISGALAGLSGWSGALVGAAIGFLTYDLTQLCPNGPPAMPTFAADDILNVLSPVPLPGTAASQAKLAAFIDNIMWRNFCECVGGTDTLGTTSAYPSGGGSTTQVVTAISPCLDIVKPDGAWPNAGVSFYWNSGSTSTTPSKSPLPAGASYATLTATAHDAGAVHYSGTAQVLYYNAAGTQLGSSINVTIGGTGNPPGAPHTATTTAALPATATQYQASFSTPGAVNVTDTWDGQLDFFCGGAPGQTVVNNCSPDPIAQSLLEEILKMVNLIQRQIAPFAYVASSSHSGLTGAGTLSIFGLIGVKVQLTTDPTYLSVEGTSPPELFGRGFLTFATADGALHSARIEHNPQLIFPCDAGVFTTLYYDLHPGVTATITELVREP